MGVSQRQKFRLLDSLTLTSSVPLVLSCSVAVVLVSSLEIKWKNLIHQSGSDFTVIFSRFLVSVSKLDFQRSSRNLVFTLIFPSKMTFCQIFLVFSQSTREYNNFPAREHQRVAGSQSTVVRKSKIVCSSTGWEIPKILCFEAPDGTSQRYCINL